MHKLIISFVLALFTIICVDCYWVFVKEPWHYIFAIGFLLVGWMSACTADNL